MDCIRIGTCVRHLPPEPHQAFIGSGVIFELQDDDERCSVVLLQGIVIVGMSRQHLFDGSWLISERVMAPSQIAHLLANAGRVLEWREAALAPSTAAVIFQLKHRVVPASPPSAWRSSSCPPGHARPARSSATSAINTVAATPRPTQSIDDAPLPHAQINTALQEVDFNLLRVGR